MNTKQLRFFLAALFLVATVGLPMAQAGHGKVPNPCAPSNPCGKKANPCAPSNPCGKSYEHNPCNPCGK